MTVGTERSPASNLYDRLKDAEEKATPGPWFCVVNGLVGGKAVSTVDKPMSQLREREARVPADLTSCDEDASLIAGARNALPAVLRLVESAQQDLAEHDEALLVGGSGDFYNLRAALALFTEEVL